MKQIIRTENAPTPVGPYSQAVRAGNLLFVSGQGALNPQSGQPEREGVAAETRRVMENLKAILEAAGSSLDRVVKTTIFMVDVGEFAQLNAIYAEYFTATAPARSTVQVAALPGAGVRLQIDAIAVA